jgi:hypothetical protein
LLRATQSLRDDLLVREYRSWRRELLRNWVERGHVEPSDVKNLGRLALKLRQQYDIDKRIELEPRVGAKFGLREVGLDAGIKVAVYTSRIWGLNWKD